jgi:hypothetical protein
MRVGITPPPTGGPAAEWESWITGTVGDAVLR